MTTIPYYPHFSKLIPSAPVYGALGNSSIPHSWATSPQNGVEL